MLLGSCANLETDVTKRSSAIVIVDGAEDVRYSTLEADESTETAHYHVAAAPPAEALQAQVARDIQRVREILSQPSAASADWALLGSGSCATMKCD